MKNTEPIRSKRHVRELAMYYLKRGQVRNHVLIVMGVHTALRISDLLSIAWDDVFDFDKNKARDSVTITERKTGKQKTIALNQNIKAALALYAASAKPGAPVIENKRTGNAISRIQAYRIIRAAAEALDFAFRVSCHSLRKVVGYFAWKSGIHPAVIMDIYNHSSFAVTMRYLGISQDDKNAVYIGLDVMGDAPC